MLNQKIRAKIKKKYNKERNTSINVFNLFDPFKKFEETKLENFKNSSRLEGLEISSLGEETTLAEILAKYRKVG